MDKYFLTARFKLLHAACELVLSVLIGVLLFILWDLPIFNLIILILLSVTIVSSIYWIRRENIVISEEGIDYEGPDLAFTAKWKNAEKITSGWYFPIKIEGIIIDKSSVQVRKMAFGMIKRFPLWGTSQKVFIPLACFSENWRRTKLGQQIKQYAPHLFEKEKSTE